jgi:hypothetical protein
LRLLSRYNQHVTAILDNWGDAPPNAVRPRFLERDGLFKLEVDEPIWQILGLLSNDDTPAPAWLGDENTHKGIVAMLDLKGCTRELEILARERTNIQTWYCEEYAAVLQAICDSCTSTVSTLILLFVLIHICTPVANDVDLTFHLKCRQNDLNNLGTRWRNAMGVLPSLGTEPPWPSVDLTTYQWFHESTSTVAQDVVQDEEESDGEDLIHPQHEESIESEAVNMVGGAEVHQGYSSSSWSESDNSEDGWHDESAFF